MDNKKFNILITSSSRKVSLVKAFEKALADLSLEGNIYTADSNPLSAALYYNRPNAVISSGTADAKRYSKWLEGFCLDKGVRLIVPTRDEELALFARLRAPFGKKGIFINAPSEKTVKICNDKKKFYEHCKSRNLPTPEVFRGIEDAAFPCFIKARYGKGSRLAFMVSNKRQLRAFISAFKDCIVQEYLDWPECTVDYFADFGGNPVSAVPRQRIATFGGESFVGRVLNEKFIIDAVIKLARGLNLIGHNTVQLFYNPKGRRIKFIEVNPRYGGGAALGVAAGANTPLFLIKLALGQPVNYRLRDLESDLYMFRYTEDLFIRKDDLMR